MKVGPTLTGPTLLTAMHAQPAVTPVAHDHRADLQVCPGPVCKSTWPAASTETRAGQSGKMRWSPRGARLLLQIRIRVLNNDLADDSSPLVPRTHQLRSASRHRCLTHPTVSPGLGDGEVTRCRGSLFSRSRRPAPAPAPISRCAGYLSPPRARPPCGSAFAPGRRPAAARPRAVGLQVG